MRAVAILGSLALALVLPAAALGGHGGSALGDHPAPPPSPGTAPGAAVNSGGEGASWQLLETLPTGSSHTDLDFFTRDGDTYAAAGSYIYGPNGGGQTIVRLTDGGAVAPEVVSAHPTASCVVDPSNATGLQHDVEATPKGGAPLNIRNPYADRGDAQLLIDATDAPGRCHDQGALGFSGAPQGGLEIIDITDVANPAEIGLTSHAGESHTVNIDPKRPHIAYSVTSDSVGLRADGTRDNEGGSSMDLDGFEVVDLSSCMDLPAAASLEERRAACRPRVYRYRYPSSRMSLGHTDTDDGSAIYGCHELEVYPSDLLTCASGNALIGLDMSRAFDDMGTPTDFTDDRPRGRPLPCTRRESTSLPAFATGAKITDCVDGAGEGTTDLSVGEWLAGDRPRLRGVRWLGSVFHMGGGPRNPEPPYPSAQDISFDHEAELTASGRFLLATDERGGGFVPPGASCAPAVDYPNGNGGLHAYRFHRLHRKRPTDAKAAWRAYARTKGSEKAIFRAPIHTGPQASYCTSHLFQQIPGQNRIFMAWFSQGTQVVDFKERRGGRIRFIDAGYLIPDAAISWVSQIFDWERNPDGTVTYRGVSGDSGRFAVDVYEATLPAPPRPKRPRDRVCRKLWDQLHDRRGRPFATKSACLDYAVRR